MTLAKDTVRINVDIDKDVKKFLDKASKDCGLPTTAIFIRNLLIVSLHDLNIGNKLGLVQVVRSTHALLNKIPHVNIKGGHPLSASENTVTFSLTIKKDVKDLLDKYVEQLDIPFKKLTRNLIYTALDDYKFLKNTGLLRIAYLFRKQVLAYREFEEKLSLSGN